MVAMLPQPPGGRYVDVSIAIAYAEPFGSGRNDRRARDVPRHDRPERADAANPFFQFIAISAWKKGIWRYRREWLMPDPPREQSNVLKVRS